MFSYIHALRVGKVVRKLLAMSLTLRATLTATSILVGCAGSLDQMAHYKMLTGGHVGCRPAEVTISELDGDALDGRNTWTASCRGSTYYCSDGGYGIVANTSREVSCTPARGSESPPRPATQEAPG